MASKVTFWLTDSQMQELKDAAQTLGVRPWEVPLVLTMRHFDDSVPGLMKVRKRDRWLAGQELATREEFEHGPNRTSSRIVSILGEADGPMSTQEVREALGWKKVGGLSEILREVAVRVPAPENVERKRGRQPHYWMLSSG